MFYIPGVYGDEQKQAMLRHCLADRVAFHTIDLPDSELEVEALCDLATTAQFVVDTIVKIQGEGDIYLVGFSFGASLAVEVASQLESAGRIVAYLGLIDGPLAIDDKRNTLRGLIQLLVAPRVGFMIYQLLRRQLAKTYKLARHFKNKNVTVKRVTSDYRFIALENWIPKKCVAAGIIILSILSFEQSSLTWKALCPNCKQVKVRSNHHHLLLGKNLSRVAALLADDIADRVNVHD